jgi:hypothetical protein
VQHDRASQTSKRVAALTSRGQPDLSDKGGTDADTLMSEGLHHRTREDPAILAAAAYVAAERRSLEADRVLDECTAAASKRYPEIPLSIIKRLSNGKVCAMTLFEAARSSSDEDDFERRKKLIENYDAAIAEILSQAHVPELEIASEKAIAESHRLMKVLRDTRATTTAGMLAKLRIAIDICVEGMAEEVDPDSTYVAPAMFSSVIADLKRMVGDRKILIGAEFESVPGSSAPAGRSGGT